MRESITTDCRNTSSTTNPEDEEVVDSPGKDVNAPMSELVKRTNPQRKMMTMMMTWAVDLELKDASVRQKLFYLLLRDPFITHSLNQ